MWPASPRFTAPVTDVKMTSTFSRTNSAAISEKRSVRPSAHRYSIATVRPSIQPSSRNRRTNAATQLPWDAGVPGTKIPTVGNFPVCCARTTRGHIATAPPRSLINLRRRIYPPEMRSKPRALSLSLFHWVTSRKMARD
jgi:hypothetical protein